MELTMTPARQIIIRVEADEVAGLVNALTIGCSACELIAQANAPTLTGTPAEEAAGILEQLRDDVIKERDRWAD